MGKELVVHRGPRGNPVTDLVILNGVLPDERLTPVMARRALRIAQGSGLYGEVWDECAGFGYRLYPASARKLYREL